MPIDLMQILQYAGFFVLAGIMIYTLLTQKKRQESFNQQFLEPRTAAGPDDLAFDGEISPEIKEEIRALYCTRDLWAKIVYSVVGLVVLVGGFLVVRQTRSSGGIRTVGEIVAFGALMAMMCLAGTLAFVVALWLPRIWFFWWWPKYELNFGLQVSGSISDEGVRLVSDGEILPWTHLYAAEMNENVVLLYLSNAYAYPLHRSMFASPSDWESFVSTVRERVKRVKDRSG